MVTNVWLTMQGLHLYRMCSPLDNQRNKKARRVTIGNLIFEKGLGRLCCYFIIIITIVTIIVVILLY